MLENKESLKSTYSHRAVGQVLSIKVSLVLQTTCSHKRQVRRVRLAHLLQVTLWEVWTQAAGRPCLVSLFPPLALLQLQGSGEEKPPACFFWNTCAYSRAEPSWRMVNTKGHSYMVKAKQMGWDFSSTYISKCQPFFTWWNCKGQTSYHLCICLVDPCGTALAHTAHFFSP